MQASATRTFAMVGAQKPAQIKAPKVSTQKLMNKKVSNAKSFKQILIWQPNDNKQFETFSYLPPLTDDQIAKQVDYIITNNWTPALEFANPQDAFIKDVFPQRFSGTSSTYYDNRYWVLWKLPMFGCNDSSQVLREVAEAAKCFPEAYVRLLAFDANRQVQVLSFLVHRPPNEPTYCPLPERSVGVSS